MNLPQETREAIGKQEDGWRREARGMHLPQETREAIGKQEDEWRREAL